MADISINAAWGGVQKGKTTTSQRHLAAARTLAMRWDGMGDGEERAPSVRASELVREQRPSVLSVLSSPLPIPALALALALRLTPQDKRPKVQVRSGLAGASKNDASQPSFAHPSRPCTRRIVPKVPSHHYCTDVGTQFLLIHGTPSVCYYRLHSCR